MKNTKTKTPLTDAEIREGLERLRASALMTSPDGRQGEMGIGVDYTGAADMACNFKLNLGPELWPFAEA
jgi:hypothetical protein